MVFVPYLSMFIFMQCHTPGPLQLFNLLNLALFTLTAKVAGYIVFLRILQPEEQAKLQRVGIEPLKKKPGETFL